ncbi:hypothetical protein V5799_006333 [Amblyomma americanum]|uniref:Mitochondrial import inner membrane translocase subunit n=1 Tax=Amblyomma americanum TaxID=6943 RepID=A0AAQ4DWP6_AMBAM
MAEDAAIRNFRDFLLIYNRMTETCFRHCVNNLNYRDLTPDEVGASSGIQRRHSRHVAACWDCYCSWLVKSCT